MKDGDDQEMMKEMRMRDGDDQMMMKETKGK